MVAVADVVFDDSIENCFFKMSAYVWLVVVYTGLSSHHGRRDEGGLTPGGIDL